ncbi:MAG: TolB protein [Mariprofundaceae bacterium]
MKKILMVAVLSLFALPAQASGLFDVFDGPLGKQAEQLPADSAELLTLEPKQSEMYPRVSPDGKYLLSLSSKHKNYWISRHSIENGDPLNIVTDDLAALVSATWSGSNVCFLSNRTGRLSLWKKPADGEGLMHRVQELTGKLKNLSLLTDGSVIAARLTMHRTAKHTKKHYSDNFNNWNIAGTNSYIVRIFADGSEKRLSVGMTPNVSPDGSQIVFSMAMGRSIHLFMMNIDGSDLVELTDARSKDVQPSWSPDGKWIAFTSNRAHADMRSGKKNQWDIWVISSLGKNLTRLSFNTARDGAPSIGPNGFVYFHSDRKVDKVLKAKHQIQGQVGKFHIWKIALPQ